MPEERLCTQNQPSVLLFLACVSFLVFSFNRRVTHPANCSKETEQGAGHTGRRETLVGEILEGKKRAPPKCEPKPRKGQKTHTYTKKRRKRKGEGDRKERQQGTSGFFLSFSWPHDKMCPDEDKSKYLRMKRVTHSAWLTKRVPVQNEGRKEWDRGGGAPEKGRG